ncbi:membrane fusion protein [Serratia fonticola]|uniref:Membrane fusion protein n=1 Tax=Serratia fonticola TaxID=47917 RepID=A0A542BHU9_SERFO|nr:membrane fusion protein [Serratia fonticola]TQI94847.1 membrane fusion protein [Serratia fonticola]TVZ69345.1 membrane fusion protein [Serratia fonticola]
MDLHGSFLSVKRKTMNKKSIFRTEALEGQRQKWVGKALLLSGLSAPVVAALCFAFIFVIVFSMFYFEYTRRIDVDGEIITLPHSVNILSPQQGYIIHSYVKVGDRVKKGDPLYELDVARITTSGNVSSTTLVAIKNQMDNVNAIIEKLKDNKKSTLEALQKQIDSYEAAHKETIKLVQSAKTGVKAVEDTLKNYEDYLKRGLITRDQLNYQRSLFQQQQSSYQGVSSQSIQEEIQLAQLYSDKNTRAADFDNQISQNESQLSDFQRQLAESDANNSIIISAKIDGMVESLSVTSGQMVESGASLAQIKPIDNVEYYLVLWLPNNSLPYIKVGDGVNIRYDAFPSDKFGQFPGKINSISSIPASPQEMAIYSSSSKQAQQQMDSYYKVMVSIKDKEFSDKGKMLSISSGLHAKVIVFLDKKPLYQWAFSPLYNIKNSVVGPVSE